MASFVLDVSFARYEVTSIKIAFKLWLQIFLQILIVSWSNFSHTYVITSSIKMILFHYWSFLDDVEDIGWIILKLVSFRHVFQESPIFGLLRTLIQESGLKLTYVQWRTNLLQASRSKSSVFRKLHTNSKFQKCDMKYVLKMILPRIKKEYSLTYKWNKPYNGIAFDIK